MIEIIGWISIGIYGLLMFGMVGYCIYCDIWCMNNGIEPSKHKWKNYDHCS